MTTSPCISSQSCKNLHDWLSYIEQSHPIDKIELGLSRVQLVAARGDLANLPGKKVLIAGTNGKGTTARTLEQMLIAQGLTVAVYTSPHLLKFNERLRLNGADVSDELWVQGLQTVEQLRQDIALTYFEFTTLAAFAIMKTAKVDVCLVEVGLGGRLDATNIISPDVSVITTIDLDHQDWLGNDRETIGREKAGIFRSGKVAICADMDVPQAVTDYTDKIGAHLWRIGREFSFEVQNQKQWNFRSITGARSALPYPALRGAFQLHNASAALAALDALKEKLPVSMEAVRRGLVEVQLAGRFQLVPGRPTLILDVAHNPHAARSLAQNLSNLPPAKTFAVFAMLRDKDMAGVVQALDTHIDTWLVAGIAVPRGATSAELAQVLQDTGVRGDIKTFGNIAEALQHAYNAAGENDRIAAFGSFYTVAEAMAEKGLRVL